MNERKKVHRYCGASKDTTHIQKSLQSLRNIGQVLEAKLCLIGITTVDDFMKAEPEELYNSLQSVLGQPVDRCVLYCFLGAKLDLPWHQCKKYFQNDDKLLHQTSGL